MQDLLKHLTPPAQAEPDSGIVNVAMYGFDREGIIPFWSGQGNLPTPEAFCRPTIESLLKGETYYTYQGGIPELREALARYHTRHFGRTFSSDNFYVTGGGMQAIQIALQMTIAAGDEVVIPTPAWPNYAGPLRLSGAVPVEVPLDFANGRWAFDIDRLAAAITPRTKALLINSPSNPLGFAATPADLIALRDLARKNDLWIIADEVYAQFHFVDGTRAPSFLDICGDDERVIYCNTFSKNWAMTGWRQGWMQVPKILGPVVERFVQYNTSGSPVFLQRGCAAALDHGDDFIAEQVKTAHRNRDIVAEAFRDQPRLRFEVPQGAFYFFFAIDGVTDSLATAKRIVDEANIGFAPGSAFGTAGEGFMRMCYLKSEANLREGLSRFGDWLQRQ